MCLKAISNTQICCTYTDTQTKVFLCGFLLWWWFFLISQVLTKCIVISPKILLSKELACTVSISGLKTPWVNIHRQNKMTPMEWDKAIMTINHRLKVTWNSCSCSGADIIVLVAIAKILNYSSYFCLFKIQQNKLKVSIKILWACMKAQRWQERCIASSESHSACVFYVWKGWRD